MPKTRAYNYRIWKSLFISNIIKMFFYDGNDVLWVRPHVLLVDF